MECINNNKKIIYEFENMKFNLQHHLNGHEIKPFNV